MPAYTILGSRWFTTSRACIGIIAVKTNTHEPDDILEWKAYIGCGAGYNRHADEQHVAANGTGLASLEAAGFFPWLDVTKYKKG